MLQEVFTQADFATGGINMAGWTSIADMVAELETNGKIAESYFYRISSNAASSVAGGSVELFQSAAGSLPAGGSYSGSAGVAVAMTSTTAGAIPLNGNVTSDLRFLLDMNLVTSNGVAPLTAYLCDFLLYYPGLNINASPTSLNNTVTLPRYTNGIGVMGIVTTTTLLATSAPTLTFTYTDSVPGSTTGAVTAVSATSPVGQLFANNGSPFIPMGSTGRGIKSLTSYTIGSGTATGVAAAILVKPLMAIPLTKAYISQEKDMVFSFPSFPKILDGACLGIIITATGAETTNSVFEGKIRYGWG